MNIFKIKKTDKKEQTANDLINIADVKENILYTKDNLIFTYLKLDPIPVALMSNQEKEIYTKQLKLALSPIDIEYKIMLISRPTDVRRNIEHLENMRTITDDKIKKDLIILNIKYLSSISQNSGVLERLAYICIYCEKTNIQNEEYLIEKANEISKALSQSRVNNKFLLEQEIVNLCNMYLNPYDIKLSEIDTSIFPTTKYNEIESDD